MGISQWIFKIKEAETEYDPYKICSDMIMMSLNPLDVTNPQNFYLLSQMSRKLL